SGHVVAISNVLQDKPNEECKVYATLVPLVYLVNGGFLYARNGFVINTQPLNEKPCQPKVNVIPHSNQLLVLTSDCLKIFEYACNTKDTTTAFTMSLSGTVLLRNDWLPRYPEVDPMLPLFISSVHSFEFMLLKNPKVV
ncbi:hypothetical protein PFISCL1PPCAC_20818, partial [Pristionchus fissidentatus]